jgi:hypothetical protein
MINSWLGRWFVVRTFEENDDKKIEQGIREIRALLDKNASGEAKS